MILDDKISEEYLRYDYNMNLYNKILNWIICYKILILYWYSYKVSN
jgi:hypothetical protein